MGDDKVTRLPVSFKTPPSEDEPMLKIIHPIGTPGCSHRDTQFLIREGEMEVECKKCGERLDPMFVLRQLAHKETRWHRARENYQEEVARLQNRKRTKCEHCGKMTGISRR